ncbi:MAG: DUF4493 domain-containing protein [Rikenellaceae bacterium]
MKKLLLLILTTFLFTGCDKALTQVVGSGNGVLNLSLASNDGDFTFTQSKGTAVDVNEFYVEIYNSAGSLVERYESYSDVPEELELEAGSYTIKAANGDMVSAGFDAPHYSGETTVAVEVGAETKATVVCTIDNLLVNITFSDDVLAAMTDIEALVTSVFYGSDGTTKNTGSLVYEPDGSNDGWFTPPYNNQISITVTGTSVATGTVQKASTVLTDASAGQSRNLEINVETTGNGSITIVIDGTLEDVDDGTLTLPDDGAGSTDPEVDPDPEPTGDEPEVLGALFGTEESSSPFDIDEDVDFDLNVHTVLDILLKSSATGGIQEMGVTIGSPTLTPVLLEALLGTSGEMDFANPDTELTWYTMFISEDIALIDPEDPIKGKSEHTFVVGSLLLMLKTMQTTGTVEHKFHIRLKDANGETNKTLTVNLTKH